MSKTLKYNEYIKNKENENTDNTILNDIKKELIKISGVDAEYDVKIIDNRTGKQNKKMKMKIDTDGQLDIIDKTDVIEEGLKDALKIGVVCTILASGMVSCKKDQLYDIGKDARFIVKPKILNTLGKETFDAIGQGTKDKVYLWYGNQNGNGGANSRPAYFDYTNKTKSYGPVTGKVYPDSAVGTGNGITPNEVIKVVPTATTKYPISQSDKNKWKYLVLVKVHPSTTFDWSDPSNGKEIPDDWKTGYALYLMNTEGMQGDLYPTFIERIYGLNRDSKGTPVSNSNYKPVMPKPNTFPYNFIDNWSSELYKTAPDI